MSKIEEIMTLVKDYRRSKADWGFPSEECCETLEEAINDYIEERIKAFFRDTTLLNGEV